MKKSEAQDAVSWFFACMVACAPEHVCISSIRESVSVLDTGVQGEGSHAGRSASRRKVVERLQKGVDNMCPESCSPSVWLDDVVDVIWSLTQIWNNSASFARGSRVAQIASHRD